MLKSQYGTQKASFFLFDFITALCLFYNGSLRMGGIERVLVEVLQNIDKSKIDIDLVIEDGTKTLNVFEKDIPKEIVYTIKEAKVEGYESKVEGNAKDGFVITNKNVEKTDRFC